MDNRSRIRQTAICGKTDRAPFFLPMGPWYETVDRWQAEGLEPGTCWDEEFGFDPGFLELEINLGYCPKFEFEVLQETENTRVVRNEMGIVLEEHKKGRTVPRYIRCPVRCRDDWLRLKEEKLDVSSPLRFPQDWHEIAARCNTGDHAVQLGGYPYGLFGTLREMMGPEELLVSFLDKPDLIHEIMDYLTDFWIAIYHKVCSDITVDCIALWEDMSGKQGSLISPAMVEEFMAPNYKRIRAFADAHDIPMVSVDTDGNCSELVPLFMECGINAVMPFEVAAGSDIVRFRREYPGLCIIGGIDKREIAKGKDATDKELDRVSEVMDHNGYFPGLDHLVHPDISWKDFQYFVYRLKDRIGVTKRVGI